MWERLSQRDKILHAHSHCKNAYLWVSPQLSLWCLKNILLKWSFNTAAVCCSGPSQLYSVTALDHCLYNTSAFSPEPDRYLRSTFPCWNICTEHYSLASGITVYWCVNRLLLLLFMQPTAYREFQRQWIWESAHHIFSHAAVSTCHRGSTLSHGSPDHHLNCPFGIKHRDFPRAYQASLHVGL